MLYSGFQTQTHFLIVLLIALFFSAALTSGVLAANIARSISEPILEACHLADELAHENAEGRRLPVTCNGELGSLSQSFNRLLDRLQKEKIEGKPK